MPGFNSWHPEPFEFLIWFYYYLCLFLVPVQADYLNIHTLPICHYRHGGPYASSPNMLYLTGHLHMYIPRLSST